MVAVCCICLSSFKSSGSGTIALNCGHVYHRDCIDQWLLGAVHRKECSSCRSRINKPQSMKELFLNFDAGDASTLTDEDISSSVETPQSRRNQRSKEKAEALETLQCQLKSCQAALAESINGRNNLESENNNLKAENVRLKRERAAKTIETQELKLKNDKLSTRILKAKQNLKKLRNSKNLLGAKGHDIEAEIEKYLKKSKSREAALKTLTTVVISLNKGLKKEKRDSKTENQASSALNFKLAQPNAKSYTRGRKVTLSRAIRSLDKKLDEYKSKIAELISEADDESGSSSDSNSSSMSPQIGKRNRKIVRPRKLMMLK